VTAYHAVKRTGAVKPTDTVVIFGLGGLGFNALQIVLAIGSRVIVMDKREAVLVEAINFGVPKQDVIPVGKDPVEFIQENKIVVDVVIDFVGVNDTFTAAQQLGKSSPPLGSHW
jgi:propanol-preferring alcohol dehydrogenase